MSEFSLSRSISVSRPHFWIYLLGPYMLGVAAGYTYFNQQTLLLAVLYAVFFTLPANLLLYGINDAYDYETDRLNPKKQGYEGVIHPHEKRLFLRQIFLILLPFLALSTFLPTYATITFIFFLMLSVSYSMPPLRFKTKPILDSVSNILYMLPGIIGYSLFSNALPPTQIILAASLWCMAMHAYSAVPDISSDTKAGMATIATFLGRIPTLLACLLLYVASAVLIYPLAPATAIVLGIAYVTMIAISLTSQTETSLLRIYRVFPYLNTLGGAMLFISILSQRLLR